MKHGKFARYDRLTKFRAVFIMTLGFLQPELDQMDLDDSFFKNLHEFARTKIVEDPKNYYPQFLTLLPSIQKGNTRSFYESDKTKGNLYSILSEIHTMEDYIKLLDSGIGQSNIDEISNLATEYLEYMNSFDENYEPTLLPQ